MTTTKTDKQIEELALPLPLLPLTFVSVVTTVIPTVESSFLGSVDAATSISIISPSELPSFSSVSADSESATSETSDLVVTDVSDFSVASDVSVISVDFVVSTISEFSLSSKFSFVPTSAALILSPVFTALVETSDLEVLESVVDAVVAKSGLLDSRFSFKIGSRRSLHVPQVNAHDAFMAGL